MCALRAYKWKIGGKSGELQAENVGAAIVSAVSQYVDTKPSGLSEAFTALKVQVQDKNYTSPPALHIDMPEFLAFNHENKGNPFIQALWERGYRRSGNLKDVRKVDFILSDHAILSRVGYLKDYALSGVDRFFVYPHTARHNLVNDIVDEYEGVTAHFVAAHGHVEVMRAYGYKKPLHVVGWSLCPIAPFRPRPNPWNVLFAPIHGRCARIDQQANQKAFARLLELVDANQIHLIVRYYRTMADSGLEEVKHPGITYHCIDDLTPDWSQIDESDVVISHQTFAWMAVARGVPTVMFGENISPHLIPMNQGELHAKNWEKYRHLVAYPYDLLACAPDKTLELLHRAAASDRDIADWRARLIGEPFDPNVFVDIIEGYL